MWVVNPNGRTELQPLSENRFRSRATTPVEFQFDDTGPAAYVTAIVEGASGKPDVFEAASQFAPSTAQLNEYAGVYASDEIDALYRIVVDKDQLVLKRLKSKPATMQPTIADVFLAGTLTIRFVRDVAGRVSGALVSSGHITNFRFRKR